MLGVLLKVTDNYLLQILQLEVQARLRRRLIHSGPYPKEYIIISISFPGSFYLTRGGYRLITWSLNTKYSGCTKTSYSRLRSVRFPPCSYVRKKDPTNKVVIYVWHWTHVHKVTYRDVNWQWKEKHKIICSNVTQKVSLCFDSWFFYACAWLRFPLLLISLQIACQCFFI